MENTKKWYTSKTIWVDILAILAIIVQAETGFIIKPELQVAVLGGLNILLRKITKGPVVWK